MFYEYTILQTAVMLMGVSTAILGVAMLLHIRKESNRAHGQDRN